MGICFIDHFVSSDSKNKNRFQKLFITVFLLVAAILIGYKFLLQYQFANAKQLAEEGRTNEAYSLSNKFKSSLNKDYRFTTFYLDLMHKTGRTEETISDFQKFHSYHCNQILHSIVADAYNESGDSITAEKHYLTALYNAPYRLQSRQDLLDFYLTRGDSVRAKYWAQQILDCPMKIITSKGIILKERAEKFIKSSPSPLSQTPSAL